MKQAFTCLCVSLALAAFVAAQPGADGPRPQTAPASATRPSRAEFAERYGVLTDRNIFLRDRSRARSQPAEVATRLATTAPSPVSIEQSLVLTGVVFEGGDARAYFEDLRGGEAVRVAAGEPVPGGRGRVLEIAVDAVAYERGGGVAWIEIGQDLTGTPRAPSTLAEDGAATRPGEAAATAPAAGANPAASSIEERMRLRRQQEQQRLAPR